MIFLFFSSSSGSHGVEERVSWTLQGRQPESCQQSEEIEQRERILEVSDDFTYYYPQN